MKYKSLTIRILSAVEKEDLFEKMHKKNWKLVCIDSNEFAWFVEIEAP